MALTFLCSVPCVVVVPDPVLPLQAGLNITHVCLPPESSEDEVMTTEHVPRHLFSLVHLAGPLASSGGMEQSFYLWGMAFVFPCV